MLPEIHEVKTNIMIKRLVSNALNAGSLDDANAPTTHRLIEDASSQTEPGASLTYFDHTA